jgi:hypothetical protein
LANWKRISDPAPASSPPSRNYLSNPKAALDLLPAGPLREALAAGNYELLRESELRIARSLAAWFEGYWVRAYTEADVGALENPKDLKLAELKRQISSQATLFSRKSPRPTVSVCMIVRDNERTLERAIKSIIPVADEIVIVDTGSTDSTLEIARKYTDRIYHFDWIDDFAAARNEALKHATKDWILSIDSDEILDPTSVKVVHASVHDASCIYSPLQPTTGRPSQTFLVPRLFPRRAGMRWIYPLHEQILFDDWDPMAIPMTAFVILADGYIDRGPKSDRNLRIIERMKQGAPEERDLALAYETFERYRSDPHHPDTETLLKMATQALKDRPSGVARRTFMLLGSIYAQQQRWPELRSLVETADAHGFGGLWSKHALAKLSIQEDDLVAAVRFARAGMAFRDFEGPIAPMRAELAEIIRLHG